jgi:hypothetical protein
VKAGPGGDYRINALPDGTYFVHAGEDRNGDLLMGYFDRRWGSFGGSTTPATVSILQSSIAAVSFPVAWPLESEQNGTLPTADPLPVGGYAYGTITSSSDVDLGPGGTGSRPAMNGALMKGSPRTTRSFCAPLASKRESYVVTTGTGSGMSTCVKSRSCTAAGL